MNQDQNKKATADLAKDVPVTVFIAEPLKKRLRTNPRAGDTLAAVAARQDYLDMITGWGRKK